MDERTSTLVDFLDIAASKPVLLVGDFMLDEYLTGDAERISPEAPVPVLRVVDRQHRLGGSGSVAASLRGLGCVTHCAGVVGTDAPGGILRRMLSEIGADLSCLVDDTSMTTPLKQRLIGLAQHRIPQQLMRVDYEQVHAIGDAVLATLKKRIGEALPSVSAVAIEDYDKGLFAGDLSRWVIDEARKRNIPVVVDPARISDYDRYRAADVITPNRLEASLASGIRIHTLDDARAAGKILCERFGVRCAMITLDADGIMLVDANGATHVPTERLEVFDITGAGDVVLATLAFAMAAGLDVEGAAMLANVAGGWEVQQIGCTPITRDQLQWELVKRHRRHRGKVVALKHLVRELDLLRRHGKRVVFTNGCFDLLHPGHVTSFEFARSHGDVLVVGLNSDASVRALKGPSRPLIDENNRARMIAALESVDYVVIFSDPSVYTLIQAIQPDILVKGHKGPDSNADAPVGADIVHARGGRVVLAPIENEYSTTSIIDAILSRAHSEKGK